MARTLITLPAQARRGETVEVRCMIGHPMETGYRVDERGQVLPIDLIRRFECRYNGELVFGAQLFAAVAANPLLVFDLKAEATGPVTFSWEGDKSFAQRDERLLTVVP